MKCNIWMLVAGIAISATLSCEKKQASGDIIAPKPVKEVKRGTQRMDDSRQERGIDWVGNHYKVVIERKADTSLPLARDESNHKYYDNRIQLRVIRADGSEFFNRTFTKSDFSQYLPREAQEHGALLGIVLDKADGDYLRFAASVGSPDALSDEYVPLVMSIYRMGDVSVVRDTQLDTVANDPNSKQNDDDDDGV